jgi:hypothetical protein
MPERTVTRSFRINERTSLLWKKSSNPNHEQIIPPLLNQIETFGAENFSLLGKIL